MSPKEKIEKLEGILARVKERAEAPRPRGTAAFPSQAALAVEVAHAAPEVEPAHPSPTAPPPASRAGTQPPPAASQPPPTSAPPELSAGWSDAPPTTTADPVIEMGVSDDVDVDADMDMDMDVEVSAEVVEVDIDIDEPDLMPAESGAMPVADPVVNGAAETETELQDVRDEEAPEEPEELTLANAPAQEPPPPANEVVEPAPSSSPRPIASEQPEAYEAESAPRHTPPPESGKQVAAPSVKPDATRLGSLPPPSLDSHTLIGGWREPGAANPREARSDVPRGPAVRVPPPPPPPPPPLENAAAVVASREPSDLEPVVTKAELPDVQVAVFEGTGPVFVPATFGDLLDATLGL
jgi:hypothetical protein